MADSLEQDRIEFVRTNSETASERLAFEVERDRLESARANVGPAMDRVMATASQVAAIKAQNDGQSTPVMDQLLEDSIGVAEEAYAAAGQDPAMVRWMAQTPNAPLQKTAFNSIQ